MTLPFISVKLIGLPETAMRKDLKTTLYLIPCPLDNLASLDTLSPEIISTVQKISYFIVENAKSARQYIKRVCPDLNISELVLSELSEHTKLNELPTLLQPLFEGNDVGLVSEAGCPCIADPGSEIVKLCHQYDIRVSPLVGPSSILLSLMGSGLNGQSFAFHGYLPIEPPNRRTKIKELELESRNKNQSQIFIETPYRNDSLLKDLLETCSPTTQLCIATNLTTPTQSIRTKSVSEWRPNAPIIGKNPTVFLLLANKQQ